jgi:hypothetical protein
MPGVPLSLGSFTAANKTRKAKGVFTPRSKLALSSEGFVEDELMYVPLGWFGMMHPDESEKLHKRRFDQRESSRANKIEISQTAYAKQNESTTTREDKKKEEEKVVKNKEAAAQESKQKKITSPMKKRKKTMNKNLGKKKASRNNFKKRTNAIQMAYGSPVMIKAMKKNVKQLIESQRLIKNPNERQKLKKSKSTMTLQEQEERKLKMVQSKTQKEMQAMLSGELRRQAQINEFKRRQDRIDAMNLSAKAADERRKKNAIIAAKKQDRVQSVLAANLAKAKQMSVENERRVAEANKKKAEQDEKKASARRMKRVADELARAEKKDRIDRAQRKELFKRKQMLDKMDRDQQRIAAVKAETRRLRMERAKVVTQTLEDKVRMKVEFEKIRNKLNPDAFHEDGRVDWRGLGLPKKMVALMTNKEDEGAEEEGDAAAQ